MNFSVAQIMSVTGHTSVSSCAVYQRVSNNEKQVMGDVISSPIKCQVPALPAPQQLAIILVSFGTNIHQLTCNCLSDTAKDDQSTGLAYWWLFHRHPAFQTLLTLTSMIYFPISIHYLQLLFLHINREPFMFHFSMVVEV
jgi:hypothetical protein